MIIFPSVSISVITSTNVEHALYHERETYGDERLAAKRHTSEITNQSSCVHCPTNLQSARVCDTHTLTFKCVTNLRLHI